MKFKTENFSIGWDYPIKAPYYGQLYWRGVSLGRIWWLNPERQWDKRAASGSLTAMLFP